MKIKVNNTEKTVTDDLSLSQLMDELTGDQGGVAVAVNRQVITKTDWTTTFLRDGDEVIVIKAACGG